MLRLFVSLYLFIALSLIGLAAGLERLLLSESPNVSTVDLVKVINAAKHQQISVPSFLENMGLDSRIIDQSDIAFSAVQQAALNTGQAIHAIDLEGSQLSYFAVRPKQVLEVVTATQSTHDSTFAIYAASFFILLGAAIALWLLPLWKDLNTLQHTARKLSPSGLLPENHISKRSLIYPTARAFNQLRRQIHNLLNTQRELSGAVAHELRTPLARLKFAIAVQLTPSKERQEIEKDIHALEKLVQEMLDYTSADIAEPELNLAEIPVQSLCRSVYQSLENHYFQRLEVVFKGDDLIVLADEHYIERAIANLLINASRFATRQIHVSVEQVSDQINVHVEDDGQGIPQDLTEKVFTPFYRLDPSRNRYQGGAGLGLAIVRRIAHWHRGTCTASASEFGGAKFSISLPCPEGDLGLS